MKLFVQLAVTLSMMGIAASLTACTNSGLSKAVSKAASNVGQNGANNAVINYGTYKIASVSIGSTAASASVGYPVTITFDTSTSTNSISTSCTVDTGAAPCACKFTWNEVNTTSGSAVTIPRTYFSNVTSVSGAQVGCSTPPSSTWQTDIADNTGISISVIPASSETTTNPNQFTVTPYAYTKGQVTETGNFTDSMGRSFVNILRYTCYEQRQRGLSLVNKIASQTITNINTFKFLVSNQFCLRTANGTVKGGDGCDEVVGALDYSAQSYYYNMFIRDSESGDANPGNALFVCPQVTESLNQQAGAPGTQGKLWPMDSSFALSLGKTADFSVGIVANSKTTNINDPTAKNTTCDGSTPAGVTANSLISSCLGFAAKPNVNGTCPKLTVSKVSGTCPAGSIASGSSCLLPTYRLRRFIATYPPIYDTDGNYIQGEAQRVDTVYVLDRPVVDASSNILLDSNGTPYSMLGPKPCPFSFFDTPNLTGAGVGYHGTNHAGWSGKNVDNIFFPYQDTGSGYAGTCAAVLPQNDPTMSKVTLTTLNAKQYVRPIQAWSPHYEEDTGFLACAPQSNPLRDPPLHFAYNGSNMAWCAEVYPTQNDNSAKLPAGASIYTSHTVHNVTPNTACNTTTITGHAANNNTCDRTVVNPSNGITWAKFPLLAPETEVTKALQTDPAFGCMMTYDNGGAKVNSSDFTLGQTPSQGCCANVSPAAGAGNSAHLESTAAPTTTPAVYTQACTPPRY